MKIKNLMATNTTEPKTIRKALGDLTNAKSTKLKTWNCTTLTTDKKQQVETKHQPNPPVAYPQEAEDDDDNDNDNDNDNALDCLLLVQSDLTSLLHQIDDLVVQALKVNDSGKRGTKEVKSFAHALSDISSSLKPWIPRLQKALFSRTVESGNQSGETLSISTSPVSEEGNCKYDSPEQTNMDLLISPSPLVSWRANCTIDRSKQLFLLTPLPMPKASTKHQWSSRFVSQNIEHVLKIQPLSELDNCGDRNDYMFEDVTRKHTPTKAHGDAVVEKGSSKKFECTLPEFSMINIPVVERSCIKTSPPKSCILLEPTFRSSHQTVDKVYKSTPFPVRNRSLQEPYSSLVEMGSSRVAGITLPESSIRNLSTTVATPCFKTSPPNTCVLLEPMSNPFHHAVKKVHKSTPYPVGKRGQLEPDTPESSGRKSLGVPELRGVQRGPKSVAERKKYETSPDWFMELSPPKTCVLMELADDKSLHNQNVVGSSVLMDATPMFKEPGSMIWTGRRPGENTLKKELWAKFEAASSGLCLQASAFQKTKQKGFLDLLEEASSDEREMDINDGQR